MDKDFYYQKRAQEHQREISQELETRNLLQMAGREPLTGKQVKRLVLRIVPAVIVMTILLLALFSG
jgi:hypothetical protein